MRRIIATALLIVTTFCVQADGFIEITPGVINFDYREFSANGDTLNHEQGYLPGFSLVFKRALSHNIDAAIVATAYSGDVDYMGSSRFGKVNNTITATQLKGLGLQLLQVIDSDIAISYGLVFQQWRRHIQTVDSIVGPREHYRWLEISAGIETSLYQLPDSAWLGRFDVIYAHNPEVDVDLSEADYGTATLEPKGKYGAQLMIQWQANNQGPAPAFVDLFFKYREFGESDSRPTTGGANSAQVFEPESKTRIIGISAGYRFSL